MRAVLSGYIALCGIWFVLAAVFAWLAWRDPRSNVWEGAAISGGIGLLFAVWLRGFKITIADGWLEYRDGLFRSSRVMLADIDEIHVEWIAVGHHGMGRKIPRIVVSARNGAVVFRVNPKPFAKEDLRKIPGLESEIFVLRS